MPETDAADDLLETDTADDHPEDAADDHLEDVEDGCGCTEIWEHLSERRADD